VDIYCATNDLVEIGHALRNFPSKMPDEYIFEYGTSDPNIKFYRHFKMRVYTVGSVGRCAIQFMVNLNKKEPEEGMVCFSIHPIEPASINKLSDLFLKFSELQDLEFQWSPTEELKF